MTADRFVELLEWLTGTPVKTLSASEVGLLSGVLADNDRQLDCSQFNELLLLANKDRVEAPFFEYFFCPGSQVCFVKDLPAGVERFQKSAMLEFGNFIYAYRTLSRIVTRDALLTTLGELARDPAQVERGFLDRTPRLLTPTPIAREDTHLTGYLSPREIVAETARAKRLREFAATCGSWDEIRNTVERGLTDPSQAGERRRLLHVVDILKARTGAAAGKNKIHETLDLEFRPLAALEERLQAAQSQAETNTDMYLTWDHMDVYFATSMRKRWEFEDLYDFVSQLMDRPEVRDLRIRHFDPTQSFERNRIDKGLIESLMLKRAKCTVYSVQDTDTLGKDSELAATLAQGKPVIAYAPKIDVSRRTDQLMGQRALWLRDRLRFVLSADESFADTFDSDLDFIGTFDEELRTFEDAMPWRSVAEESALASFRRAHEAELRRFCRILAESEKSIYDRRANTLIKTHPLAIQVNLDTGVANGVLVVRDVGAAAMLLRRILLNQMEYDVKDDKETECWLLVERLTGSIYRVVTKNRKLTNCFWNFYRRDNKEE